jgi:phosphate-selective porin OprO and OprP
MAPLFAEAKAPRLVVLAVGAIVMAVTMAPGIVRAQGDAQPAEASIDTTADAGEADAIPPKRRMVKWNEFDGPVSTLSYGYGFLVDFATYAQDDDSKQQVSMEPDVGLRDFRLLARGKFKTTRPFTWTLGYMYDGADKQWRFRQTGLQIGIPELSSRVFLGRTKLGYSQTKVMTGYYLWGVERSQTLDAFIPILGDGIKWMTYAPRQRIFWDLGFFADALSEEEKFAIYDDQTVSRLGWQPILSDEHQQVLHVAVMGQWARSDGGKLRLKSKPGAYLAPNFLDTGTMTADRAETYGFEAVYRMRSWFFATEYNWEPVHLKDGRDPVFNGGDISAVWLVTGETRPYNRVGGFFQQVTPKKSVFEGGRGAVEAVLNLSYSNFDDQGVLGGKFWRTTPMMNWHLAEGLRVQLAYGYGVLDRFGLKGATQFFQARLMTFL